MSTFFASFLTTRLALFCAILILTSSLSERASAKPTFNEDILPKATARLVDSVSSVPMTQGVWRLFRDGLNQIDVGEFDSAFATFNEIIRQDPNNSGAFINRGFLYSIQKNQKDSALLDYRHALELGVAPEMALYNIGDVFQSQEIYDSAETYYRKALEHNPTMYSANMGMGGIQGMRGEYDEAMLSFVSALQTNEFDPRVHTLVGHLYYSARMWSHAINSFEKAVELDSTYWQANYYLGLAYLIGNAPIMAARKFTLALEVERDSPLLLFYRGKSYGEQQVIDSAIADFDSVAILVDDYCSLHPERGRAYAISGDLECAIEEYSYAIECDSTDLQNYRKRVWYCRRTGDISLLLEDYDVLVRLEPENLDYQLKRLYYMILVRNYESALSESSRILEKSDNEKYIRDILYLANGFANYKLKNNEVAIEALKKVSDDSTAQYVPARYFLAKSLLESGRADKGRETLVRLTSYLEHSLTELSYRRSLYDEASAALTDNMRLFGFDLRDIYQLLESRYRIEDNWRKAEKKIKRELRSKRSKATFHYLLGRVYEMGKKLKKAQGEYKRVTHVARYYRTTLKTMSFERMKAMGLYFDRKTRKWRVSPELLLVGPLPCFVGPILDGYNFSCDQHFHPVPQGQQ